MHLPPTHADLDIVVDLMRNLSLQTDPQAAAALYGTGLRKLNIVPSDRYLSLSRRDLPAPQFRITRNTDRSDHPNPWTEKHKLPILSGGLLAEILYSNEPAIITDLPARLSPADPAFDALRDMQLLVALPHYDQGHAINAGILLNRTGDNFPFKDIPLMVWQANLWGRATLNLVNQQKLQQAHDAMDAELKVVADIQRSLLPRALPEIPNAQVAVHYQTSQRAGGDYYDFFPLPGNCWGILLADVSGHGTPAAVLMAITHAIAHTHPGHPMPPDQLLAFVNTQLAAHYTTSNGTFVTAIYAIYNATTRTLTFSSAGHPSPRLLRNNRVTCMEGESSYPLGIHAPEQFISHTCQLQPCDHLLFYTDGITEAFDPAGELFGTQRLDAAALAHPCESPSELISRILADLSTFSASAPPTDDRTLVALQIS